MSPKDKVIASEVGRHQAVNSSKPIRDVAKALDVAKISKKVKEKKMNPLTSSATPKYLKVHRMQ